jgi:hypothetical protein
VFAEHKFHFSRQHTQNEACTSLGDYNNQNPDYDKLTLLADAEYTLDGQSTARGVFNAFNALGIIAFACKPLIVRLKKYADYFKKKSSYKFGICKATQTDTLRFSEPGWSRNRAIRGTSRSLSTYF